MLFIPTKEYQFLYLVLRFGNKYFHSNSFVFNESFEVISLKIIKLTCTNETFVPFVGTINKKIKGHVFLDNNQGEWYLSKKDSSRPSKISVAHASAWNHFDTDHERKDIIGHMFVTELGAFVKHLSDMLLQKDLKSFNEVSILLRQIERLSSSP